jgi:cellulose synthase/poly-beta-1,6-N-acetylglucosamine synthase-like glycosyltransferase
MSLVLFYIWVGIACLLLLWQSWRYAALAKGLKEPKPVNNHSVPPVSVLIAAHNAAKDLKQNLPLLLKQDHPNFEVWVLNNGSNDASNEVLAKMEKNYPNQLRILHLTKANKKAALTAGIAQARYPYLVFTDADCRPASNQWLSRMAHSLASCDAVLGYGPLSGTGFTSALSQWETLQTAGQYYWAALRNKPYMGVGRNLAYRQELFNRVNGFAGHKNLPSGDDDLLIQSARKVKAKVGLSWAPESFVYSPAPKNLGQWWRQKRRHFTTASHYDVSDQIKLGAEGGAQFLFYALLPWAFFVNAPLTLLFFLIRYLFTLLFARPTAGNFRAQSVMWVFPVFEAVWSILATALQVQNALWGKPKKW